MSLTNSGKISQKVLQELSDARQKLELKKKQKSQISKEIKTLGYREEILNGELWSLINQGIKVSRGKFIAALKVREIMHRVAWKQMFIQFVPKGEAKAEKLMNDREPEEFDYVELSMRE